MEIIEIELCHFQSLSVIFVPFALFCFSMRKRQRQWPTVLVHGYDVYKHPADGRLRAGLTPPVTGKFFDFANWFFDIARKIPTRFGYTVISCLINAETLVSVKIFTRYNALKQKFTPIISTDGAAV